ncbi:EVE domain-containing protein [Thalassospira mesophila]|uniref:Ubiquinol-cytochrome C reductase n=1 Tax=Thalassospira mesophila TaxID=1293891 RepID=A0A1Y2L4G0_9PROT|nr:EVE domain-containing protein [Thalassospira mesophila]OSQ40561.1 ubiquinol-cytochrome C reductase [Thalassospira mesophila]
MAYWLIKTEPSSWSWDDQVAKDVEGWDGVRNYQAANNLRAMKIGDQAFFYHSVKEKSIVGIVEIVREAYPDPGDARGKFVQVDVKTVKPLKTPVSLDDIKADPRFADLALLKQSRLSVLPIDDASWQAICAMGGLAS